MRKIKQHNRVFKEPLKPRDHNRQVALNFPEALFKQMLKIVQNTSDIKTEANENGIISTSVNLPLSVIEIIDTLVQVKLEMNRSEALRSAIKSTIYQYPFHSLLLVESRVFLNISELIRYCAKEELMKYDKSFFAKIRRNTEVK